MSKSSFPITKFNSTDAKLEASLGNSGPNKKESPCSSIMLQSQRLKISSSCKPGTIENEDDISDADDEDVITKAMELIPSCKSLVSNEINQKSNIKPSGPKVKRTHPAVINPPVVPPPSSNKRSTGNTKTEDTVSKFVNTENSDGDLEKFQQLKGLFDDCEEVVTSSSLSLFQVKKRAFKPPVAAGTGSYKFGEISNPQLNNIILPGANNELDTNAGFLKNNLPCGSTNNKEASQNHLSKTDFNPTTSFVIKQPPLTPEEDNSYDHSFIANEQHVLSNQLAKLVKIPATPPNTISSIDTSLVSDAKNSIRCNSTEENSIAITQTTIATSLTKSNKRQLQNSPNIENETLKRQKLEVRNVNQSKMCQFVGVTQVPSEVASINNFNNAPYAMSQEQVVKQQVISPYNNQERLLQEISDMNWILRQHEIIQQESQHFTVQDDYDEFSDDDDYDEYDQLPISEQHIDCFPINEQMRYHSYPNYQNFSGQPLENPQFQVDHQQHILQQPMLPQNIHLPQTIITPPVTQQQQSLHSHPMISMTPQLVNQEMTFHQPVQQHMITQPILLQTPNTCGNLQNIYQN